MAAPTMTVQSQPMMAARPTGVAILAVLDFLGAAFWGMAALMMFAGAAFLTAALEDAVPAGLAAAFVGAFGVLSLVFAGLYLLTGWGLWAGKGWARILTIVFAALWFVTGILSLLGLNPFAIVALGVNGFILWYMMRPWVKRYFENG